MVKLPGIVLEVLLKKIAKPSHQLYMVCHALFCHSVLSDDSEQHQASLEQADKLPPGRDSLWI